MERSDTPPQLDENKPVASIAFEVVRRTEFVFEPFLGSLIQLPAARMQRAQSSEFFLASTASAASLDALGEEKLVWERPGSASKADSPPVSGHGQKRKIVPVDKRKEKKEKAAKELEAPRFYQPQTVRFFDPVAAAAEEGAPAALEQPESRGSIQLSPELKAAILRIDEQRRRMQQEEKPGKGKKRGLLKGRSAKAEDEPAIPVEIVESRDVALTERAARWEEIAAPQPAAEVEEGTKEMAALDPIAEEVETVKTNAEEIEQANEVVSAAMDDVVAATLNTPLESMASAVPEDVAMPEAAGMLEEVATPEAETAAESIQIEETVFAPVDIPIGVSVEVPIDVQMEDPSPAVDEIASLLMEAQLPESLSTRAAEATEENDEVVTWEQVPTEEAILAPDADWEAPLQGSPVIEAPLSASVVGKPGISESADRIGDDDALFPVVHEADSSTVGRTEEDQFAREVEFSQAERQKALTAAISQVRRADLVVPEPVQTVIPQIPVVEPPQEEEKEPRSKREKLPFSQRLQRWLGGETSKLDGNRRRAERVTMPGLVAFYWSGGVPKPHEIVNISRTGFYLKTAEFWSVETLVRMTLQRPSAETKRKNESISVLARVVRIDEDGVGHEFVTTEALAHKRSMDVMPSQGTDSRQLDRFLHLQ